MKDIDHTLPKIVMAVSAVVFTAAGVCMSLKIEPFFSWYYLFAWWPYIFGLESLIFILGGYSTLYDEPKKFAAMLPASVIIWLVFEAYNFRLANWSYINIEPNLALRWAGYALSFATVLPGISVTKRLLEFTGLWEDHQVKPLTNPQKLFPWFFTIGIAFLTLPLVQPQWFFPLVWGGFIFLLEPALYSSGGRSLLRMWQEGSLRQFFLLLAAGGICGFLWESWNFWAGAKWQYHVPYVGFLKVFEMPVLGFLGFPPFAVACWVMGESCRLFGDVTLMMSKVKRIILWTMIVVACALFTVVVFDGIDQYSVRSFGPSGDSAGLVD